MNEQLQSKLVEILNAIQSAAKAAGDFAMEQLPDIAQQYVAYGRAFETTAAVVLAIAFVVSLAVGWKYREESEGFTVFLGCGGAIVSGASCALYTKSAMLVWFAPKVWLLKEIAGMLK